MKIKYYSEELDKYFDSKEELIKEEKAIHEEEERKKKLEAEKAKRKAEVDEAFANAQKLLSEYVKDYGSYSQGNRVNTTCSTLNKFLHDLKWFW